jgi:EmrB/QacA subfamily drug resistance transporter
MAEEQAPTLNQSKRGTKASIEAKWLVLAAIGIGTFMSALDGSVVNTILPVIKAAFKSDVATVEWVVTTYLLVVSALLLSFGRLGDLRGNKTVYVIGFLIFVVGSAACGLSPTPAFLVAARAFQALGAAMLFANSPAILTKTFPAGQRGQALGIQGAMTYLGLTTGPLLGGWLSDTFGWHSVFFINVPVGLFATWMAFRVIPKDMPSERSERFDLPGAVTFTAGLIVLLLGLNQGQNWGWFSAPILGLLAGAILLFGAFIWLELRLPAPMLDLSLFRGSIFRSSAISPILNYISIYCVLFLMPFYLIQGRGLSPSRAGLILTTQPLVMALTAPFSGTISDRAGTRLPTTLGMLILAAGLYLFSRLTPLSPYYYVVIGLGVTGLGTGMFVAPNGSALMGDAPKNRQGIASGVLALARNVGMVLGIGLAGAIFTTILAAGGADNLPETTVRAVGAGFLFASSVAMLAALVCLARGDEQLNVSPESKIS